MDYRLQLKAEFDRRKMVNARYSLRAFAHALDVSAAFLSNLFQGKKNLSLETALLVAEKLGYSDAETAQFCQLIQIANAKSSKLKAALTARRESPMTSPAPAFAPLELEAFQALSDWYHYGILVLCECDGFQANSGWIAKRLGIRKEDAEAAIGRLLRLGLIKHANGTFARTETFIATTSDQPSQALRNHHLQMIEKAKNALQSQSIERRDITGITLAVRADQLPLAKKEIKRFRRRMARLLETPKGDDVYQLNIQFFSLSHSPLSEKI
jgi:uncharacterized protein (TIGR02147 family)